MLFRQIGCSRLSLNGVVIAKMAVTQSTKTIHGHSITTTNNRMGRKTRRRRRKTTSNERKRSIGNESNCYVKSRQPPQQTLVNNTHFLPSSPYIFNTFSVRLTTPESKQCFERAGQTKRMNRRKS